MMTSYKIRKFNYQIDLSSSMRFPILLRWHLYTEIGHSLKMAATQVLLRTKKLEINMKFNNRHFKICLSGCVMGCLRELKIWSIIHLYHQLLSVNSLQSDSYKFLYCAMCKILCINRHTKLWVNWKIISKMDSSSSYCKIFSMYVSSSINTTRRMVPKEMNKRRETTCLTRRLDTKVTKRQNCLI